MSTNKEALTGTNIAFSTRSMAPAWMLDLPEAGADRMFSFEERICRNGQTSVSATVGPQRASNERLACGEGEFRDDLNATSLERHFSVRNAPYAVKDRSNPVKSQKMRPPLRADHEPAFSAEIAQAKRMNRSESSKARTLPRGTCRYTRRRRSTTT
jgi:hypothetical protein